MIKRSATTTFAKEYNIIPMNFIWNDGKKYEVDKVLDKRRAASLKAGGQGIRYKCRVLGKDVYMFLEDGRWFMESKQ